MPILNGLVGNEPAITLRSTGCSAVIVKRDLVKQEQLTGKVGYVMTIAGTLVKAPFANVEASTLYFSKAASFMCKRSVA